MDRNPLKSNEPWKRVIEDWHFFEISVQPGASVKLIDEFQSKYNVILPKDVRNYFMEANGTDDEGDQNCNRFWPLTEVSLVEEVWMEPENKPHPNRFDYPSYFIFVDYLVDTWHYAIKLTSDPTQQAPVMLICNYEPDHVVASSFRKFMELYADDNKNIF